MELGLTNRYTDSATLKQLSQSRVGLFDPYPIDLANSIKKSRRKERQETYGDDILGKNIQEIFYPDGKNSSCKGRHHVKVTSSAKVDK